MYSYCILNLLQPGTVILFIFEHMEHNVTEYYEWMNRTWLHDSDLLDAWRLLTLPQSSNQT